MAGDAGSAPKICGICGTDCTSKSRIKDAQGNYFCKECAEKRQAEGKPVGAAKPPPVPAGKTPAKPGAPAEPNIMAKLVDESIAKSANACPACRRPMKDASVICTHCGFNRQTAQMVQTQVKQAELIADKSSPGRTRRRIRLDPSIAVLAAIVIFGGLLGLSFLTPVMVVPTMLLILLFHYSLLVLITINAFQDGYVGWGILGVCSFFCGPAYLGVIYHIWMVTERDYLKSLWLIQLVSWVVALVLYTMNADAIADAINEMKGGAPQSEFQPAD